MRKRAILLTCLLGSATAQNVGQKAIAAKITTGVKGTRVVACPILPGDPLNFKNGLCISGPSSASQLVQGINQVLKNQLDYPDWFSTGTNEYINGITQNTTFYGVGIYPVKNVVYLRITAGEKVTPPVVLSSQSIHVFNQLIIKLTGEVVPCVPSTARDKKCALTPFGRDSVKLWIRISDDIEQVEPWETVQGDLLLGKFQIDGQFHSIFLSDLGDKGTLLQWVR